MYEDENIRKKNKSLYDLLWASFTESNRYGLFWLLSKLQWLMKPLIREEAIICKRRKPTFTYRRNVFVRCFWSLPLNYFIQNLFSDIIIHSRIALQCQFPLNFFFSKITWIAGPNRLTFYFHNLTTFWKLLRAGPYFGTHTRHNASGDLQIKLVMNIRPLTAIYG